MSFQPIYNDFLFDWGFFSFIYNSFPSERSIQHLVILAEGKTARNYFLHPLAKIPYAEISKDYYF